MLTAIGLALALAQPAQPAPPPVERRIQAPEARQGVASDGSFVYAVDNQRLGKYAISTGRRVASWSGDPKRFPHLNSCTIVRRELVCAMSNYPAVPQASSVEFFDSATLRHRRSVSLGLGPGSLTVIDHHRGEWWGVFANYDGRGGQPGRDHRSTLLVRMDDQFRQLEAWTFPTSILARFAPRSASGASWTADGRLAVSGHDHAEIYVVRIPDAGTVLDHVATVPVATPGQAIDWDPRNPKLLWSIDRARSELVASYPRL
ncbi:MAG: hypothetical protein H0U83_02880 [Sphingomonas sp.]|nr:hypothetical protein [Sphingomonas sp.]